MFRVVCVVGSRLVGEELPLFVALFGELCMYCSGVLEVSDFSFGYYRLITKISFVYFVFGRVSLFFIFVYTGSHLEERGDVF